MNFSDDKRTGDWIQTYSGRRFWPLDPRSEEVSIVDIAHALSMKCRYGGHSKKFYSVAEHSVLVSLHVPHKFSMWGLLHDAAEAYSADIVRPLKKNIPQWADMERKIMDAICEYCCLDKNEPLEVTDIDERICADERKAVMNACIGEWDSTPVPVGAKIRCLSPKKAKSLFIDRYCFLASKIWRANIRKSMQT